MKQRCIDGLLPKPKKKKIRKKKPAPAPHSHIRISHEIALNSKISKVFTYNMALFSVVCLWTLNRNSIHKYVTGSKFTCSIKNRNIQI